MPANEVFDEFKIRLLLGTAMRLRLIYFSLFLALLVGCATQPPVKIDQGILNSATNLGTRLYMQSRRSFVAQSAVMAIDPKLGKKLHYLVIDPDTATDNAKVVAIDFNQIEPRIEAEVIVSSLLDLQSCANFKTSTTPCDGVQVSIKTRDFTLEEKKLARAFSQLIALEPELEKCTREPPQLLVFKNDTTIYGYVLSVRSEFNQFVLSGHWRFEFSNDGKLLGQKPLYKGCLVRTAEELLGKHNHEHLTRPQTISLNTPVAEYVDESHIF